MIGHITKVFLGLLNQLYRQNKIWISLILAIGMCFSSWLSVSSNAQSPGIAVVLNESLSSHDIQESPQLLSTLKQLNQNISTIQLKELTNFKGNLLIVPLKDDSSKAFLDEIQRLKGSDMHLLLLPMLSRPNTRVEHFLEAMGFQITRTQFISYSLPLKIDGVPSKTFLPIGSFVIHASATQEPLMYWGNSFPAAVRAGNSLLVNWNWSGTLSFESFRDVMSRWAQVDRSLVAFDVGSGFSQGLSSAAYAESSRIIPTMAEQSTVPASQSSASTRTLWSSDSEPPKVTQMYATPAQQATRAASSPQPQGGRNSTQSEEDKDSNPDELYDFDGGNKRDRQALAQLRNSETQTAIAEYYNDRMRELAELQEKVTMLAGQYMHVPQKHHQIQAALDAANQEKSRFETAWFQQNFGVALTAYEKSRDTLMGVLFEKIPDTVIEGRAIWMDRGSIVNAGNEAALRQLIRRVAASGFNVIYFETINAGYPIYPSRLVEQNPQVKGWDPLAVAVDEAHKQGVELHAWVWAFAVGNTRHNKILGQPDSFPGPILSKPELASEALRGRNGEMILPEQYEYWLSPASPKAREFLSSLYAEIVHNYPVDGLQLDYIRYPFQKPNTPMGFEPFAANRFTAETGLSLSDLNDYTLKAWDAWKAFQVTTFVRELSYRLKSINPEIKLSAAVFPLARHGRMLMIQQDWETWVRNGWIDTLNPMAYSRSARSLERLVSYVNNVGGDKTLVYPGLSLKKLNAVSLLDTLEICRRTGVMGTTLFAYTQFDNDKQLLLQRGPYRQRKTVPPHRNPLSASVQLISEVEQMVDSMLRSDLQTANLATLGEIKQALRSVSQSMSNLNPSQRPIGYQGALESVRDQTRLLEQRTEQWAGNADNSVAGYQSKILKQMVDKAVRLVNYTTYQLSEVPALQARQE